MCGYESKGEQKKQMTYSYIINDQQQQIEPPLRQREGILRNIDTTDKIIIIMIILLIVTIATSRTIIDTA